MASSLHLGAYAAAFAAEVLLVLLGVVAMSKAVADVLAIVADLPARADKDDEKAHKFSRSEAKQEFGQLLVLRLAPGAVLSGTGCLLLLVTVVTLLARL